MDNSVASDAGIGTGVRDYSPTELKIYINKALVNLEIEIAPILALTFSPINDAEDECGQ